MPARNRDTTPAWFLDEMHHAGKENLDPAHAARYDEKEDADATGEVTLLETLGLTRDSVVLDVGAGTGQFTVAVAPRCARVLALDVSAVMLHRLDTKVAALGLTNVATRQAGFLTYEHAGAPVDFVYSRLALHHLPDFWKAIALARLRRTVRTDGVVRLWDVVYDLLPSEVEAAIEAWCATGGVDGEPGVIERAWTRAELEEHVRDEHSTFTWLLEPMIERCGFTLERTEHSPDRIVARYVLRAR